MTWDSVVLLSLAESSLKIRQTMATHARYVFELEENLMYSSRIRAIGARHAFRQPSSKCNVLGESRIARQNLRTWEFSKFEF